MPAIASFAASMVCLSLSWILVIASTSFLLFLSIAIFLASARTSILAFAFAIANSSSQRFFQELPRTPLTSTNLSALSLNFSSYCLQFSFALSHSTSDLASSCSIFFCKDCIFKSTRCFASVFCFLNAVASSGLFASSAALILSANLASICCLALFSSPGASVSPLDAVVESLSTRSPPEPRSIAFSRLSANNVFCFALSHTSRDLGASVNL